MSSLLLPRLIALSGRQQMEMLHKDICRKMKCRLISLYKFRAFVCAEKKGSFVSNKAKKRKVVESVDKTIFT